MYRVPDCHQLLLKINLLVYSAIFTTTQRFALFKFSPCIFFKLKSRDRFFRTPDRIIGMCLRGRRVQIIRRESFLWINSNYASSESNNRDCLPTQCGMSNCLMSVPQGWVRLVRAKVDGSRWMKDSVSSSHPGKESILFCFMNCVSSWSSFPCDPCAIWNKL